MLPLVIALTCLTGASLGLSLFALWKSGHPPEAERSWVGPVSEVDRRVEGLELRWKRLLEEVHERVESGNVIWRRIRSKESAQERREESQEQLEGEPQDDAQEVLPFDDAGGDPRGLSYMPDPLGGAPEPPWKQAARALASNIANGGN